MVFSHEDGMHAPCQRSAEAVQFALNPVLPVAVAMPLICTLPGALVRVRDGRLTKAGLGAVTAGLARIVTAKGVDVLNPDPAS